LLVAAEEVEAQAYNLQGSRPRRRTGEECGVYLRSRAQYFSFNFLSDDCFKRQIAAYGVYEVQGAKFCESKLYPGNEH
jgi:hypothetical protein